MQGECPFLAYLEEPIKSIMSYEPRRALPADSAPGPSTQIPSVKQVTPLHLGLSGLIFVTEFLLSILPVACHDIGENVACFIAAGINKRSGERHKVSGGSHRCSKGG